jgi:3-phenylpropionate/trans-cinnamate dioxygenase ferredoxin subunit
MALERTVSIASLDDGRPTTCTLSDGSVVCLVRTGDEVYAIGDRCSHADFPMSEGDMVDDHVIECPLHGAQFDVRTGGALELPATEPIPTYHVEVVEGHVWVRRGV